MTNAQRSLEKRIAFLEKVCQGETNQSLALEVAILEQNLARVAHAEPALARALKLAMQPNLAVAFANSQSLNEDDHTQSDVVLSHAVQLQPALGHLEGMDQLSIPKVRMCGVSSKQAENFASVLDEFEKTTIRASTILRLWLGHIQHANTLATNTLEKTCMNQCSG